MTSIQVSQYVGGELHEAYDNLEVDVHHPELTVYVETRDYAAFVHADPEPGAGGLPVGINGRAVSLLSGGIDSPVASWMIAKRGVALEMVHFFSYPYTSPEAKEKVLELARLLTPWCGRLTVHVVPFTAIQEELRRSCPEELFTIIMRRFMMRISQEVAKRCGAKAVSYTHLDVYKRQVCLLTLTSSLAFFQSAGTSYFLKAVAPRSMALWFMSTISWPFFR